MTDRSKDKCRTIITNNLPTAAVTPAKRTVSNILLRILTGMASPPLSLVTARLLHTTVTVYVLISEDNCEQKKNASVADFVCSNRRQDTASRRRLLEMRCMVEDSLVCDRVWCRKNCILLWKVSVCGR